VNPLTSGSITLDIYLKEAISTQMKAIIYAEYDNLIQINKTSVQKDYM